MFVHTFERALVGKELLITIILHTMQRSKMKTAGHHGHRLLPPFGAVVPIAAAAFFLLVSGKPCGSTPDVTFDKNGISEPNETCQSNYFEALKVVKVFGQVDISHRIGGHPAAAEKSSTIQDSTISRS